MPCCRPRPVWLMRAGKMVAYPLPFEPILCVVESEEASKAALARAVAFAENNQANLTVVDIAPPCHGWHRDAGWRLHHRRSAGRGGERAYPETGDIGRSSPLPDGDPNQDIGGYAVPVSLWTSSPTYAA